MSRSYLLESEREFQRLETQGQIPGYDCESDFKNLNIRHDARVLDAGSGSGIASRYLASRFPKAQVIGCDISEIRVNRAREAARQFQNVRFVVGDLSSVPFESESFDVIVCRYVFHHLPRQQCLQICREFYRCLKRGGTLISIEPDGIFDNLYPMPKVVDHVIAAIKCASSVDLFCGRKMSAMLCSSGFELVDHQIQTLNAQGRRRADEVWLMDQRLSQLIPALTDIVGNMDIAQQFKSEFIQALKNPFSTYFHNKFIVTTLKPKQLT